jgi:hypothetical protein
MHKNFFEVFEEALNAVKFLGWQNIFESVKGQGLRKQPQCSGCIVVEAKYRLRITQISICLYFLK